MTNAVRTIKFNDMIRNMKSKNRVLKNENSKKQREKSINEFYEKYPEYKGMTYEEIKESLRKG